MPNKEMDELEKIELEKSELKILEHINSSESPATGIQLHAEFDRSCTLSRVSKVLETIVEKRIVDKIGNSMFPASNEPVKYEKNDSTNGRIAELRRTLIEIEAAKLRKIVVPEELELTVLSKIEELSKTPPKQRELFLSMKSDGAEMRAALVKIYDMGFVEADADAPTLDERSFTINPDGRKQIDELKRRAAEIQRKAKELKEMNERARQSQIISDAANDSAVKTNEASRRNNKLTLAVAFLAVIVSIISLFKDAKKKDNVDLGPWKTTNEHLEKQSQELNRIADKIRVDTIKITQIKYLPARRRARKYNVINILTDKVVIDSTKKR